MKIFLISLGMIILLSSVCFANDNSDFFYLTWESDGFVPIDYQGKALVSDMGIIKVSIQPFIYSNGYIDVGNLEFRWYLNDEYEREGVGLSDFRFRANKYSLRNYSVRVEIVFPNNNIIIEEIEIPVVSPKAVISPNGVEHSLKEGILNVLGNEVSLTAIPYFFGGTVNFLKYTWFVNGNRQTFDSDSIIIERFDDQADIEVVISSSLDSLVRTVGELRVLFFGSEFEIETEEL
jgi:hypothetical protein